MSSILKVNTIQDLDGNLIISKDSGGSGFLSPYASSSAAITYTVTVASKTSAHPYFGVGSSNGYLINGIEAPIIEIKGNDTSKPYHYKFDQSDSSNNGHPLLFYNNVGKTTGFSTGVTTNGTPGQAGAYTMIAVDSQTPNILYYQCSQHANMGNHTFATSPVVNTGVFLTLPTADGSSGQFVKTNGSGVLSFASVAAAAITSTANGADNRVATYSDADSLNGEANLTFDGSTLGVNGAAIFNESGADKDFRVESDGQENMLVVNGGLNRVGVGEDNPLGTLHVKTADSGATASADGDDLVIENGTSSGTAGMTFLSATNGYGSINFGDSGDNNIGIIDYEHSSNTMRISTNASEAMRIHSNGVMSAVNGIALGVGTANTASNVLDDYEEGTWDATVACGSGTISIAANGNTCKYTKIGRSVLLSGSLNVSSVSSPSGDLLINGMPFPSGSGEGGERATGAFCLYNPTDGLPPGLICQIFGGYASIRVESSQAGDRGQSNHVQGGSELRFTINYQIGS